MLLAIDVGNINITFGVYDGQKLITTFRMMSMTDHTSDEYGVSILDMLRVNGIDHTGIDGVIVASVVPKVMHSLQNAIAKYLKVNPMVVGPGLKTGVKISTPNPKEIGADRIVDVVAAYEKYGYPVLVLDFGTADTFDLIDENGVFTCGVTAPGIKISANALWNNTARLPEVEIRKPDSILAQDTVTSMQAGLFFGHIGQTKYIIENIKKESGIKDLKVVSTGGFGGLISPSVDSIDVYDRDLTLDGLRIIYEKNQNRKSGTKK